LATDEAKIQIANRKLGKAALPRFPFILTTAHCWKYSFNMTCLSPPSKVSERQILCFHRISRCAWFSCKFWRSI